MKNWLRFPQVTNDLWWSALSMPDFKPRRRAWFLRLGAQLLQKIKYLLCISRPWYAQSFMLSDLEKINVIEKQSKAFGHALPSTTADTAEGWGAVLLYSTHAFLVNLVLPFSTINRFLQKVFLLFLTGKSGYAKGHFQVQQTKWQSCYQDSGWCAPGVVPFP